jgi:hypothetical protein
MIDNGLLGAPLLRTNWKWIRVHEDLYHEIASLGEFGDSFMI